MITTLVVLALTCFPDPGQEKAKAPFEPQVEILKVEVSPPLPGNPRRRTLTVTFNVPPDFPRGIKINFELLRQGPAVGKPVQFTLENEIRKNIKVILGPNERLTADKYCISTSFPLADQSPEVRKFLEGRPQRFPPEYAPSWDYAHMTQEFVVGTPEDEAAELEEFARFAEANMEKILDLNNQGMDELEKVKQGSLDQEALKKFMAGWMGGMAEVQQKMIAYPDSEPGLYFKFQRIHQELLELARMVSRRITRIELGNVLRKHNLTLTALRLPTVAGFDPNYRFRVAASDLEVRYAKISALLYPEEAAQEGGEEKGLEKTSGKEGSENTSEGAIPPGKEDDEPAGDVKKDPATSDAPPAQAKKPEKTKPKKPQKSSGKTSKKSSAKEGA